MEPSRQQEQVRAIADRFVAIAPAGWARLAGSWEATVVDGVVRLTWVTLAVVDLGDRWGAGQLGFDEPLYDLVAELHGGMAQRGQRWSVLDVEVDRDREFRSRFGYAEPDQAPGALGEESRARFEDYLDTWVAEHGVVPPGGAWPDTSSPKTRSPDTSSPDIPSPDAPSPDLDAQVDQIVAALTRDHPGWIRVVHRVGRLQEPDGTPSPTSTRLNRVLVWADGGVRAEYGRTMGLSGVYAEIDRLTAHVPWTQLCLVVDRDGERQVELVTDELRRPLDDAATDPYWRQVHDYLELNRADVDALVQRLRAGGQLPGEPADGREPGRAGGWRGLFRRG